MAGIRSVDAKDSFLYPLEGCAKGREERKGKRQRKKVVCMRIATFTIFTIFTTFTIFTIFTSFTSLTFVTDS